MDIFQKLKVGFLVNALINKSSLFLSFISFKAPKAKKLEPLREGGDIGLEIRILPNTVFLIFGFLFIWFEKAVSKH